MVIVNIYIAPYSYIMYTAILVVALLLMCMACLCYIRFKPPKEGDYDKKDGIKHDHKFNNPGQSTDGKHQSTVSVTVDADQGRTEMVNISNEQSTFESERYGLNMNLQGDSNITTGSLSTITSDGDVLQGAYGGFITAPGDDETYANERVRNYLDDIDEDDMLRASPKQKGKKGKKGYSSLKPERIISPIQVHLKNNSNGFIRDDESTENEETEYEDEYEEDAYYDADPDDMSYGDDTEDAHIQTVGAPPDSEQYVDGQLRYIQITHLM